MPWQSVITNQLFPLEGWLVSNSLPTGRFFRVSYTLVRGTHNQSVLGQIAQFQPEGAGQYSVYDQHRWKFRQMEEIFYLRPPGCFSDRRIGLQTLIVDDEPRWEARITLDVFIGEDENEEDEDVRVIIDYSNFNAQELGAIPLTQKGSANGVATLDSSSIVPGAQLPVDRFEPIGAATAAVADRALLTDPRFTDAREPLPHIHPITQVEGLQTALNSKEAAGTASAAVADRALLTDLRFTDAREPLPHIHPITQVEGLQTALNSKETAGSAAAAVADRVQLGDPRLTDARPPLPHVHPIAEVENLQTALDSKEAAGTVAAAIAALPSITPILVGQMIWLPYPTSSNPWTDSNGWMWYQPNGQSIGSLASSATLRNNKFEKLFKALWAVSYHTISGGKGSSADVDWAADKTLVILDCRGRNAVAAGQGSGLTLRNVGDTGGSEAHTGVASHFHNARVDPTIKLAYGTDVSLPNAGTTLFGRTDANGASSSINHMDPWFVATLLWSLGEKA